MLLPPLTRNGLIPQPWPRITSKDLTVPKSGAGWQICRTFANAAGGEAKPGSGPRGTAWDTDAGTKEM